MPTIQRILVPTDFSSCSRAGLNYALSWAEHTGARVQVVHVAETPALVGPDLMVTMPDHPARTIAEWIDAEATKAMGRFLAEVYRPENVAIESAVFVGDIAERIAMAAKDWRADLIVVGTHGRTGLSHMLMGSVAEKILRVAPCPVLTLREN